MKEIGKVVHATDSQKINVWRPIEEHAFTYLELHCGRLSFIGYTTDLRSWLPCK